jgi:oligopeptide transport system substrate-binding protein
VLLQRPDCHSFDYLATYFIRFNVTRKPFNDPRVRKALALAVNKERIVKRITRGGEKAASHMTPDGLKNYHPPEGLGYDPGAARRLLAEAGYPKGKDFPRFQFLLNTAPLNQQIGVELQAMWRTELGIEMELRQSEWKVYLDDLSKLNYDVCRSSWVGDYKDANTFLDMFMSNNGNNRTGWKSPRYDALLRQANAEPKETERAKLLEQAEALLVRDDAPIFPLYFYAGVVLFDSNKWDGIHLHGNLVDQHNLNFIKRRRSVVRRPLSVVGTRSVITDDRPLTTDH